MNIENGGAHAAFCNRYPRIHDHLPISWDDTSGCPNGRRNISRTRTVPKSHGYPTTVGDEGGYAPQVKGGNREPFELISEAIEQAGYTVGTDIVFALDIASK